MSVHESYMQKCLDLAMLAKGKVAPNPYVGAVLVKHGRIIGQGYHKGPGFAHAEVDAINNASEPVEGATLYCNLEPCCHSNKRTPPCAQRLVKEKIKKVIIANTDPNPHVAGKGIELLRKANIQVETGLLKEAAFEINEVFFKHIVEQRPFVHLKWAQTLDGKIATPAFQSKWITGEDARRVVHMERELYDAILVGAQTLRHDNPSLSIRVNGHQQGRTVRPIKKVVLARDLNFDPNLKIFHQKDEGEVLIMTTNSDDAQISAARQHLPNVPILSFSGLKDMLGQLYQLGITSLYVEGGQSIHTQFIAQGLADRISVFIAAKILGAGLAPIGDLGISDINQALRFRDPKLEILNQTIYLRAKGILCSQDL